MFIFPGDALIRSLSAGGLGIIHSALFGNGQWDPLGFADGSVHNMG